jgi:hypothetical protein
MHRVIDHILNALLLSLSLVRFFFLYRQGSGLVVFLSSRVKAYHACMSIFEDLVLVVDCAFIVHLLLGCVFIRMDSFSAAEKWITSYINVGNMDLTSAQLFLRPTDLSI